MGKGIRVFCSLVLLTTIVVLGFTMSSPELISGEVKQSIRAKWTPEVSSEKHNKNNLVLSSKFRMQSRAAQLDAESEKETKEASKESIVHVPKEASSKVLEESELLHTEGSLSAASTKSFALSKAANRDSKILEPDEHTKEKMAVSIESAVLSKEASRDSDSRVLENVVPRKESVALSREANRDSKVLEHAGHHTEEDVLSSNERIAQSLVRANTTFNKPVSPTDDAIVPNNEQNIVKRSTIKLPDFVKLNSKCKVPIGTDRASLPLCSQALFREYYSTVGAFPECGMWMDNVGYGFSQRYGLDFCDLKAYNLPECSLRKSMHHILMLGDSTGWRLFISLVNTTIWGGNTCHLVKDEGPFSMTPSTDYFSLGRRSLKYALNVVERRCAWCRAAVYDCEMRTNSGFHTMRLEFVPAYKFKDPSLTISPGHPKWRSSNTFQEFLFNTYLPLAGMPDAIVVAMPLNHEKRNSWVIQDLGYLVDVMVEHVPRTTQVHWVPTASEFESKRHGIRGAEFINATFGRDHLFAKEQIYKINTQLFGMLKPYLLNQSYNMHGFVNLVNMSSTKEAWNEDGVHFNYLWYVHVIRTLLSIFCAH